MEPPISPSTRAAPIAPVRAATWPVPRAPSSNTHPSSLLRAVTKGSVSLALPLASAVSRLRRRRRGSVRGCRVFRRQADAGVVEGKVAYQADHVERGLTYTGVCSVDGVMEGSEAVMSPVSIKNGRDRNWDLDNHGFTRVDDVPELLDFYNERAICLDYYPQCERLVQKVTGASKVFAFYHTVRSHSSIPGARKRRKQGFPVEDPAGCVHVDYSEACAARAARQLAKPPHLWQDPRPLLGFKPLLDLAEIEEHLRHGKRWAIVNVWRNLSSEAVQRTPVALCVGTSISTEDIVTVQSVAGATKQVKEYYFTGRSKEHEWVYFPQMKREEAILIKNWDSAGEAFADKKCEVRVPSTFAFHTAFHDPNTVEGAPQRETMEVRTIVFY